MNLNRVIVVLVVLITGVFVASTSSFAAKPDKCDPWPSCKNGDDGGDIVVDFWLRQGGGTGGTIILKIAASNGIVVDELDFIIDTE